MKKLFCLSLVLLLLASCKVIDTVSIEYLKPSDISFPPELKTVGVVNNTPQGDKTEKINVPNETLLSGVFDGEGKLAAEQLAENIVAGNYFDKVIICDSALRSKDYISRETKLAKDEVEEVARNLGVDVIFSLEKVKLYLERGLVYYEGVPQGAIDATVRTMLRVYLPGREEPLATVSDTDSIYWITGTWNIDRKIIEEGSSFAATLPVKHLLPTWTTVNRYYYASGAVEMRDAVVCIRENAWDEALKLWKAVYARKNENMKMRAAYNIALYYEMQDNVPEAKEWLQKAMKIAEKKVKKNEKGEVTDTTEDYALIFLYLTELDSRLGDMPKLNIQMQRFNGNF